MSKFEELIADEIITVEELANAHELIDRANLVKEGPSACKKTLLFPLGTEEINCYSHMDSVGEYETWGACTNDGLFICYITWGGNHEIGRCNLNNFADTFLAFNNEDFASDLRRFLLEQIEKAKQF